MGIARTTAIPLLLESKRAPFYGTVLQLGRQEIYFGIDELRQWAGAVGGTLSETIPPRFVTNQYLPGKQVIDDETFFRSLGCGQVHSCDASLFEKATYQADLNQPVPAELHNCADFIFDGGTLEHVFNVPGVLRNIHSMLRTGGRIIHVLPVFNYVDHGFYNFSPTLFADYYAANRYRIEAQYIIAHTTDSASDAALFAYVPGCMDHLSVGGITPERFGKYNLLAVFFVATKTPESVSDVIPQQGFYTQVWQGNAPGSRGKPEQFQFLGLI